MTLLDQIRERWLEKRFQGLGSSDAAAALGESNWCSPYELWARKTKRMPPLEDTARFRWGHRMEPGICEEYLLEHPTHELIDPGEYEIEQHPEYPWMLSTKDREIVIPNLGRGIAELKTDQVFNMKKYDKEIPLGYQIQVQHQLAVSDLPWAILIVQFGLEYCKAYPIERHNRFISILIDNEERFWNEYILADIAPDVKAGDGKVVSQVFPQDEGTTVTLRDDFLDIDKKLRRFKKAMAVITTRSSKLEAELKAAIGKNLFGTFGGVTYKSSTVPRKDSIKVPLDQLEALNETDIYYELTEGRPHRRLTRVKEG